ncbi:MAG TPA: GDCCVxC domain-containing (seleno)protein [Gaiellaceae bacterium]
MVTKARITCPNGGFSKVETMPTDACRHLYRCDGCGASLRPLAGDCCVFCSYSDQVCPPKQAAA